MNISDRSRMCWWYETSASNYGGGKERLRGVLCYARLTSIKPSLVPRTFNLRTRTQMKVLGTRFILSSHIYGEGNFVMNNRFDVQ